MYVINLDFPYILPPLRKIDASPKFIVIESDVQSRTVTQVQTNKLTVT